MDWPVAEVRLIEYEDERHTRTNAHIQWKGTDACIDWRCDCGFAGHFDALFAYQIECPGCHAIWLMPSTVYPLKIAMKRESAMLRADDEGWDHDD